MLNATPWTQRPSHRRWLETQADALFRFYELRSIDHHGGFHVLDDLGRPTADPARHLHLTARMAHCAAIGVLLGRPGAQDLLDHAMRSLWTRHRDGVHGGFFRSFSATGPRERDKLAYGHGFVLLAGASAKVAGHPDADRLIADVSGILDARFWEKGPGAYAEEFREDWAPFSGYRGQNANMHMTEALMAAFEATGETDYLRKAESVADLIVRRNAASAGWRVPEHYAADWTVDVAYKGDDMFRPYGYTPGHALEWTRLALQLWALGDKKLGWLQAAATSLYRQAVDQGWDAARGGFYYTLSYDAAPLVRDRLWWPVCEGIGAAHFVANASGEPTAEDGYRKFWNFAARHFIDADHGGWRHHLDEEMRPIPGYFHGKPDIYHALQACLIPLYGTSGSLTREIMAQPAP